MSSHLHLHRGSSHLLPSTDEMAKFDADTISTGTSSLELMERAGRAVLKLARARFPKAFRRGNSALILCGPGNNGGDGLVIGRLLAKQKINCTVVMVSAKHYSADCITQIRRYSRLKRKFFCFPKLNAELRALSALPLGKSALSELASRSSIVFDALLGTGQQRAPREPIASLIKCLAPTLRSGKGQTPLVAVDIPTGVNASTGEVYSPTVRAHTTISIQACKRGMLQSPGIECCGRIEVVDIGIGCERGSEFALLTGRTAPDFPSRKRDAHKGNGGRILIVGGCKNMPGAPMLAGLGALRSGAGLVTVTSFVGAGRMRGNPLELMSLALQPGADGGLHLEVFEEIEEKLRLSDLVIFGPGMGRGQEQIDFTKRFVKLLLRENIAAVVDADALINLSNAAVTRLAPSIIITPHPGEAAKLLGLTVSTVQHDRYNSARALYNAFGAVTVLKGASSLVYHQGHGVVNSTGNPWMATAGSGDVLCGVIAALVAQGVQNFNAAKLGVYLHGKAGDIAHERHQGPIIASDIAASLPCAIGDRRIKRQELQR